MGYITVNATKSPLLLYTIGEDNHGSAAYMAFIVKEVATGLLNRGDLIVAGNAILHYGGSADNMNIFL